MLNTPKNISHQPHYLELPLRRSGGGIKKILSSMETEISSFFDKVQLFSGLKVTRTLRDLKSMKDSRTLMSPSGVTLLIIISFQSRANVQHVKYGRISNSILGCLTQQTHF